MFKLECIIFNQGKWLIDCWSIFFPQMTYIRSSIFNDTEKYKIIYRFNQLIKKTVLNLWQRCSLITTTIKKIICLNFTLFIGLQNAVYFYFLQFLLKEKIFKRNILGNSLEKRFPQLLMSVHRMDAGDALMKVKPSTRRRSLSSWIMFSPLF